MLARLFYVHLCFDIFVASNVMNLSDTGSESGSEEEENGKETTIEDELLWTTLQNALTANRWTIRFKAGQFLF